MKKEEVFREQIIQGFVDNVQFGYDSKWSVPESGVGGGSRFWGMFLLCVCQIVFIHWISFPFPRCKDSGMVL